MENHLNTSTLLLHEISHPGFIEFKESYAYTLWSDLPREKQTNDKLNITVCSFATNRW